ncbi:hypothetical protein EYC84_011427 [Monilinia fructicola]|uniref:Sugar phosphate transporter domain-containing protein n=1 Tax=Monilinia fructicola TaxID=38448 RepID=A0A5M9J7L0_MONFR|nr:hypothetical protein EYC84_011427 [Monilinia fructicola]
MMDNPFYNSRKSNGYTTGGSTPTDRWQSQRNGRMRGESWTNGESSNGRGHTKQKSISDAFRTIKARKGSMSANVHEISDALKAPVSPKLIILCIVWYLSSALTNTSSKSILNAFPKPATLTLIQFAFVAFYCLFFSWLSSTFPQLKTAIPSLRHGIRYPTKEVIMTTLPLAAFQIGGHLLSSTATAKIPVNHVPINSINLIFFCYSSGLAFLVTSPIWFWSEGITLLGDFFHDGSLDLSSHPEAFDHGRLALEFVFNGTFHFGQNIIAFVLLSMVSPVTYSVASLIKRVFVVVIAIIWFQNPTTKIQGLGIALTFFGLYLYDRTKGSNKADSKAKMLNTKEDTILPLNTNPTMLHPGPQAQVLFESPIQVRGGGYSLSSGNLDNKKSDDNSFDKMGRLRGSSNASWLPPGTKQEDTWRPREIIANGPSGVNGNGNGNGNGISVK